MVSPAPGSTLPGASVAFTWTAGTGVTQYQIWFGTTLGGQDVGSPGVLTATTTYTPTNLPVVHATLYVRLWSLLNGVWQFNDYTYTEANLGMLTPVPGTTLLGSSVAFTWNPVAGVTQYQIWFGTAPGGQDLGSPGLLATTTYTANNLPVTGRTLYVRLWSLVGAVWQFTDYTYTEATFAATMISPAPGSALAGSLLTFTWSAGTGATAYQIWFGSTLGAQNFGSPGILATTSYAASLPATGAPIYVRLWSLVGGVWQYIDYIYTEANLGMLTPVPGTTLVGTSVAFTWAAVPGVSQYQIWFGTTTGGQDLGSPGILATTTYTATLPVLGAPLHVRLWSLVGGVWQFVDYNYTH
jgi:hypothetical protein